MIGSYIPHVDLLKSGLQYITDSSVEYEEFHGAPNAKGAGDKDSKTPLKRPAGRSKAVLAAWADQQAFSTDAQIHEMEDALHKLVEMQLQAEAERMALDSLANSIGLGGQLPGKDLQTSFEILLKNEVKHQQARRKQNLKVAATPGGIDRELYELRTKVWEVHHAHEPLPTSAGVAAGGAEDEDEDELEIVMTGVGGSNQSLKCPITTNYLEDPVTSSTCKHSYSKEAIMSMIRSRGGHQCRCPVHGKFPFVVSFSFSFHFISIFFFFFDMPLTKISFVFFEKTIGCSSIVGAEMLHSNKALARKVARQKLIQEEMVEHEEEEVKDDSLFYCPLLLIYGDVLLTVADPFFIVCVS